jgi:succinyl-diaminopimelate desuccinylase
VIAKTGWAVSWEEVGLTWFEVEVRGSHTYVGSRHLLPYRNAIADAGHLVAGLERWFPTWADQHRTGLVAPQGVVAAIDGGWPHMPAFTTAVCRFWVDLRISPRTSPDEAAAAFGAEVDRLAAEINADVSWRQTVAIPGTTTNPDEPIIMSSIRCWEDVNGRPHQPILGLSGATDANILRAMGVPTARVGLPKVAPARMPDQEIDFQLGMNAVDVDDMERLTRLLIRIAVDVCGVAS